MKLFWNLLDRSKKTHVWSLSDESGVERALGVYWFVNEDKLGFHIIMKFNVGCS